MTFKNTKETAQRGYLAWLNDFLTLEVFAEYYGLELPQAHKIVKVGRKIHYRKHRICYPCNGRGYRIEFTLKSDGTKHGEKAPCMNCNSTGKTGSDFLNPWIR